MQTEFNSAGKQQQKKTIAALFSRSRFSVDSVQLDNCVKVINYEMSSIQP